jgi:hypothetical protein
VALLVSFIGALFVGPALGAGSALLAVAALTIVRGDFVRADTVGTTLAIAGSAVLFVAAWWVFYRLARRVFE